MLDPRPPRNQLLWGVYEEHLDEATFLWQQWERALDSAANRTLDQLIAGPEERLLAHLDALVIGGAAVAEKLLAPSLATARERFRSTAAAWALLSSEDGDCCDQVLDALKTADPRLRRALARALQLSPRRDLSSRVEARLPSSPSELRAALLEVMVVRGSPPPPGLVAEFASSSNPALKAAALRALRMRPDARFDAHIQAAFASLEPSTVNLALEAAVVAHLPWVAGACRQAVDSRGPGARLALAILAWRGDAADLGAVIAASDVPATRRDAVWALGYSGRIEAAERALSLMGEAEIAPLAADSFSLITGCDVSAFAGRRPKDDSGSLPNDAPLPVLAPDDDLPFPDAERIASWWAESRRKFRSTERYLFGAPASSNALYAALGRATMWRRRVFALALACDHGFFVNLKTWARSQRLPAA